MNNSQGSSWMMGDLETFVKSLNDWSNIGCRKIEMMNSWILTSDSWVISYVKSLKWRWMILLILMHDWWISNYHIVNSIVICQWCHVYSSLYCCLMLLLLLDWKLEWNSLRWCHRSMWCNKRRTNAETLSLGLANCCLIVYFLLVKLCFGA